ncbi:MAG TPA: hypothetical protein VJ717_15600 [Gemmatimonadaceae bacterium]|nr:hypothetical protein [Gemmatimonadaceae bacterium]
MPTRTLRKPQKRGRKKTERAARAFDRTVYLNIPGVRKPLAITLPATKPALERLALKWSYSLRNRERWVGRPDLLDRHRAEIREVAMSFGLVGDVLAQIAAADLVEVSIPYRDEQEDWALRIMPWEYLISTATRDQRSGRSLTVVRHLRTAQSRARVTAARDWFYVECAVGELREAYDFSTERDLVKQAARGVPRELKDPSASDLTSLLGDVKTGDVVHFAGFDPHQGLQLLDDPNAERAADGILVRQPRAQSANNGSAAAQVVPAWSVARQLTSQDRRPRLVACNLYYSAARTAAACVALGAESAIGFQDSFDDTLAELFYATFYQAWRLSKWNTPAAFRHAWNVVREENKPLHGSGIVLWNATSIRETLPRYWDGVRRMEPEDIDALWNKELKVPQEQLTAANVNDYLEVDIQPLSALNYSLLHNDGVLFERFTIRKKSLRVGRVQSLHVLVELHVGTDTFPYRTTIELSARKPSTDLREQIRISLASALTRALRESVRTTLFVEVRMADVVIRRETFPITLLPVDEWIDTDENRIWLPSFVQPRDGAVSRVIEKAQRYLMAIADDPAMGFSGYQAIDTEADPDSDPAERCSAVDAQVRAIWSALLYELPLSYINPPPVFSDYSQRLRTPSDVVDGGRGTCIDLALLLASCLEYVEIYPVMFLLVDHAFPGYWRDEAYHEQFVEALLGGASEEKRKSAMQGELPAGQRYGWYLEKPHFSEILAEIHAGRLVPLETVGLCEHCGFQEAMNRGQDNLTSRRHFQAMLDILSARWDEKNRVTPLPILRS